MDFYYSFTNENIERNWTKLKPGSTQPSSRKQSAANTHTSTVHSKIVEIKGTANFVFSIYLNIWLA